LTRHAPATKNDNTEAPSVEKAKCEVCLKAKIKRQPYVADAYRHQNATISHVDLSQIKQPSERGYKYLTVIVVEASR